MKYRSLIRKILLLITSLGLSFFSFSQDSTSKNSGSGEKGGDFLDRMIAIVIILFILSVIVEKITQLIRKYSPFIRPGDMLHKTKARTLWRNIRKKQTDGTLLDDKIEREVNSLSFVVGLLISIIFCVDLFRMFTATDPTTILYWDENKLNYYLNENAWGYRVPVLLVSLGLTGFFLTFGSKFFHDLLDTLFQVKNLKRKLVDDNTFTSESIEQFDEFVNKTSTDIIQIAIDQNRNLLQVADAVSPPMRGRMKQNGKLVDCIDIHLKGNNRGTLPQVVQAKLSSGKIISIQVHAIFDVQVPKVSIFQGDSVANEDTSDFKGTICCKIKKDGIESLLTCSHIFTGGTADNFFGTITSQPADINNTPDGNFIYALCTDEFDIALITPESRDFTYQIIPKKERKLVPSDIYTTSVKVACKSSNIKTGLVINNSLSDPMEIDYDNGQRHSLVNLMVLSNISNVNGEDVYSSITVGGDSGACVYDENNNPIGMIIAASNKFSFAIPIVNILNKLSATIIN